MADRSTTLATVRQKYPQYADMTDDALGSALATKYPEYADLAPPKLAPTPTPMPPAPKGPLIPGSPVRSALTAGMEGVTQGAKELVTGGNLPAAAIQALALSAVPGGLPARAAVMGAKGGATGLLKGEGLSGAGWDAMIDIALSVGTEGTLSLVKTLGLDRLGRAVRGFDFLKDAPQKALDYVLPRIQHVKKILVPSIDPAKKLTWQEAIDELGKLRGQQWKVAREEIKSQMNAYDKQEIKPAAGTVFKSMAKTRKDTPLLEPSRFSRIAQEVGEASASPGVRATADVLATEDVGGVPAGAVAGLALKDQLGHLARSAVRHLMP